MTFSGFLSVGPSIPLSSVSGEMEREDIDDPVGDATSECTAEEEEEEEEDVGIMTG